MTSLKWIGESNAIAHGRFRRERQRKLWQTRRIRKLPRTILLSIWFGLVTGIVELGMVYARNHVAGWSALSALHLSRHFPWMIPLTNLVLFMGWGVAVALLGRVWKPIGGQISVFLISFPACLAVLLVFPSLYAITYFALAAGFAACSARLASAFNERFHRLVATSLPTMFIGICLFAGWKAGQIAFSERLAIATSPRPKQEGMNVLLLVMDTVRADHLSAYGYQRATTPNLRRLAERGIRFDQAQATAPWTLPSHASMFTGLWPHQTGAAENRPIDATCPTLAEFLTSQGYLTAGFVANTYFCNSWFGLGKGFTHYEDFYNEDLVVSVSETLRSSALARGGASLAGLPLGGDRGRKTAAQINRDFLAWLSTKESGRPFFVFLNYFDAHAPYIVPDGYDQHFGRRVESPADLVLLLDWEKRTKQHVRASDMTLVSDAYDDCIAYLDSQIGKLINELERRGLLENTLVVVTSDHGEEFGEHGLFGHGRSLYSQELHVPLIVLAPGDRAAGRVVGEPVSLRDLPATVIDALGYSHHSPFPGMSLKPRWQTSTEWVGPALSPAYSEVALRDKISTNLSRPPAWRGPMQSVAADGWAYIRNADGREELYDIANDPAELRDLAESTGSPPLLRLREILQSPLERSARSIRLAGANPLPRLFAKPAKQQSESFTAALA